jgi:hypothetical protein
MATREAGEELPEALFISIADREADNYELFWLHHQWRAQEAAADPAPSRPGPAARVELLVRVQHNRALASGEAPKKVALKAPKATTQAQKAEAKLQRAAAKAQKAVAKAQEAAHKAEEERLFGHLAAQPVAGFYEVVVPRKPGQKAHPVTLAIRYGKITVAAPPDQVKYHGHTEALTLWVIEAREQNPPGKESPVCWRLLTTIPIDDLQSAILQVKRYSRRWQIEVYHKILKSGCRAEERQLESAERLERCLVLDAIVAWRVLALSKADRDETLRQGPISEWLAEHEWKALWCFFHKRTDAPASPPSTHQAVRWIAQLGGFLARRGDGHPGPVTLWRGLQRLNDITLAYVLFTARKDVGNA